ncbi:hypothetical protein AKO1_001855 [Acrasis kona]|uniref:Uncharacterized protein n=1 Tax=Acrasis kona TaxID=1008807 RepID=A0AAW2YMH6_9EUKA
MSLFFESERSDRRIPTCSVERVVPENEQKLICGINVMQFTKPDNSGRGDTLNRWNLT